MANVLLLLAVLLNFVGNVGGWDAGKTIWVALVMDLVGAALLAQALLATAGHVEGRQRLYRLAAGGFLLLWVGLSAFWRFGLPAVMGTNIEDLFVTLTTSQGAVPASVMRYLTIVYEILTLWIVSGMAFVAAHVMMLLSSRGARHDDWVRGLPVYAWLLASMVSLLATILIAVSFVGVLWSLPLSLSFGAWLVAKLVIAPNLFISGYASSLHLGRSLSRARSAIPDD